MSERPDLLPAATLGRALDALPDGIAFFDADGTIRYVNPAGAALLQRTADELVGRTIWAALPELAGSILHRFMLHARSADTPVTWSGCYPPAGRRLSATAVVVDGLLQVSLRAGSGRAAEGPPRANLPRGRGATRTAIAIGCACSPRRR